MFGNLWKQPSLRRLRLFEQLQRSQVSLLSRLYLRSHHPNHRLILCSQYKPEQSATHRAYHPRSSNTPRRRHRSRIYWPSRPFAPSTPSLSFWRFIRRGMLCSRTGGVRDAVFGHRGCSKNKAMSNAARTRKGAELITTTELRQESHKLGKWLYYAVVASVRLQNASIIPGAGQRKCTLYWGSWD
jgi:hypothetical protein